MFIIELTQWTIYVNISKINFSQKFARSTLLIYFLQQHLKAFCSKFSAATENIDYVSSGPNLFVNFVSSSGSYSGSSIYYWAIYDFHEATSDGEKVLGTRCDETLTIHNNPSGRFQSPRNTLIFKDPEHDVECTYHIVADPRIFSRISLKITDIKLKSKDEKCNKCWQNSELDHLEAEG